jgi:hypothetical protein
VAAEVRIPLHGEGQPLYVAQEKIYPREIDGRFARLRVLSVWALLGIYYLLPWLNWNDRQAVLFDLPARKFFIFGLVFWPQDFIFLALLLIIAALALFFFTAIAGRLWCGYACPQTVWTETFLWIERRIEGDRIARMRLDAAPWGWNKLWRKAAKQGVWVALGLWTGVSLVLIGISAVHLFFAREIVESQQQWWREHGPKLTRGLNPTPVTFRERWLFRRQVEARAVGWEKLLIFALLGLAFTVVAAAGLRDGRNGWTIPFALGVVTVAWCVLGMYLARGSK